MKINLPKYFRLAKQASILSDHHSHKLGAVILVNRKPISVGYNKRFKTHPIMKQFQSLKTIHAELSAIIGVKNKKSLKNSTMVVYREGKDGRAKLARPCDTCIKVLTSFGINEIIYTIEDGFMKEIIE